MIELEITEKDMQADRVLTAGWYPVKITALGLKPKSKKPSENNIVASFDVIGGGDANGDATGVYVKDAYFPSLGQAMGLFKACGIAPEKGMRIILDNLVGTEVDAYIKPGEEYNGKVPNDATGYAPLGTHTKK